MPTQLSTSEVTPAQIRAQCDRILGSPIFVRSKRQSAFLDYVVTAVLEGRSDTIKEFSLAVDVFERDESYDASLDSIVRVEASRLRSKLREYYGDDGVGDPLRIDIPKGHYIPEFKFTDIPGVDGQSTPRQRFGNRRSDFLIMGLMAIAITYFIWDRDWIDSPQPERSDQRSMDSAAVRQRVENSIAVLPFRNLSTDIEDAFFVDGIHDDILTRLSNLSYLNKVISRTSMERYRNTTKSVIVIGQELGVTNILEGSVQRAGNRVRINAQLIDAISDAHVWSKTFDRELTTAGIFDIQSEIAILIAEALEITLSAKEREALGSIPTENLEAYELFQRAQQIRRSSGLGSQTDVTRLLEEAVSLDPDFALAYVGLARAYIDRYFMREQDVSHRDLARVAVNKAIEIKPGMPEAYVALADYHYKGFLDYDQALDQLNYAIPLAPGNAEAYATRAFVLRRRGNFEKAIPDLVRAIELDPGNFSPYYVLADTYVILGQYEKAIAYYDKSIELAPTNFGLKVLRAYAQIGLDNNSSAFAELIADPQFIDDSSFGSLRYLWEIAMLERNYDLAMDLIRRSRMQILSVQAAYYPMDLMRGLTEFYVGDANKAAGFFDSAATLLKSRTQQVSGDPRILSALGFAYAGLGEEIEALEAARAAYEMRTISDDAVDGPLFVYNFAKTYAMLGEHNAAIEKLDELLSQPANWYATWNVILREPAFDQLRQQREYIALAKRHGELE